MRIPSSAYDQACSLHSVLRHDAAQGQDLYKALPPRGPERDNDRDQDVHLHTKARMGDIPMVAELLLSTAGVGRGRESNRKASRIFGNSRSAVRCRNFALI